MQISTGRIFDSPEAALEAGVMPDDLVELRASLEQAEDIGRRVRLGNAEIERRAARKAIQKASRKANRPRH